MHANLISLMSQTMDRLHVRMLNMIIIVVERHISLIQ